MDWKRQLIKNNHVSGFKIPSLWIAHTHLESEISSPVTGTEPIPWRCATGSGRSSEKELGLYIKASSSSISHSTQGLSLPRRTGRPGRRWELEVFPSITVWHNQANMKPRLSQAFRHLFSCLFPPTNGALQRRKKAWWVVVVVYLLGYNWFTMLC